LIFPFPHTVGPIIAASVTAATSVVMPCGPVPFWNPTNLGTPSVTSSNPTIVTTSPVTSGGNIGRSRGRTDASTPSKRPDAIVIAETSLRPPNLPASIEAET
jgi:hypothetical protein